MVQINFATREVSCKIVYYGPGMCGKTTNLQQVHVKAPADRRGKLTSIATEGDRTLFFDFMPLDLGTVAGMRTKFQLYTVPGQVYYDATRKIVLEGVDGIIFVADSDPQRRQANLESWQNLEENLGEYGLDLRDVPVVIQFNKRDLPDAMPAEQINAELNELGAPTFEAVAVAGEGVMPTLRKLSQLVLTRLNEERPRRAVRRTVAARAEAPQAPAQTPREPVLAVSRPVAEKSPPQPEVKPEPVSASKTAAEPGPPGATVEAEAERPAVPSASERAPAETEEPSAAAPSERLWAVMVGELSKLSKRSFSKLELVIIGIAAILAVVMVVLVVLGRA